MSASVKRKPVYCGACSMDISNAVRIRCAQLAPPPAATRQDDAGNTILLSSSATKKHDPVDSISTGPRSDGLVPTCEEFDLCGSCFCEGKEIGRHKRWHDYRVVTQHAYPIFTDDWGADEELLLISACQTFGLGNWQDIAEHIGSYRTREEVEEHYISTYINIPSFPEPIADVKLIDQDTFQARKKQRLEEAQLRPVPIPPPKPLASAPTCHELAGYMPGRLEFETEWENDAEILIKDMEFGNVHRYGGDEQPSREDAMAAHAAREGLPIQVDTVVEPGTTRNPQASAPSNRGLGAGASGAEGGASLASEMKADQNQTGDKGREGKEGKEEDKAEEVIQIWDEADDDLELKLTIMEIYNERIERRFDAKNFIFDRGLLEYKKIALVEKKRAREERDLLNRVKVFARLQTSHDHEEFSNGLLYEQMLRKQIADLQEYRQAGVTTFPEAEKYEKDKAARVAARGGDRFRDALLLSRSGLGRGASSGPSREATPKPSSTTNGFATGSSARRLPSQQLNLSNSASLQLLSAEETKLCSDLRILPKPFIFIKQTLLREFARRGGQLDNERAIEMLSRVEPRIVTRIWEELILGPNRAVATQQEEDAIGESDDESSSSEDTGSLMGELQELIQQQQSSQTQPQVLLNGHAPIGLEDLFEV